MTAAPSSLDALAAPAVVGRAWSRPAGPTLAWLYGALLVALLGFSSGGFLPTSWAWAGSAGFAVAATVWLLRDRVRLGAGAAVLLAALLGFVAWAALSAIWSTSVTSTALDVQRDLAYLGVVAGGIALAGRRTAAQLAGGVAAGLALVSLYALATRLFPGRFTTFSSASYGYRLTMPVTYWNGLGLVAALALALCFAFAARGGTAVVRMLAAAAMPTVAATAFFTFSRGAWAALVIGAIVTAAIDARRAELAAKALALTPFPALAVIAASRQPSLTHYGATLGDARGEGRRLASILVALCLAAALTTLCVHVAERRISPGPALRRAFASTLVLGALAAVVLAWHAAGSPWHVASRGWNELNAPPERATPNVTARLFQLSSSGRLQLWKGALDGFEERPLLGNGAGTFWQLWPLHRDRSLPTGQAHSIVFGTLAELGLPGMALLGTALLAPLGAALRRRRRPLVAPLAGAYAAWLGHCATDWDWQLLAVGVAGLLVGVALLRDDDDAGRALTVPSPLLAAAALAAAGVMVYALLGDRALAAANHALRTGDRSAAAAQLDRAQALEPWSSEPDATRASLALMRGNRAEAARQLTRALDKDPRSWLLWNRLAGITTGPTHARAAAEVRRLNPVP